MTTTYTVYVYSPGQHYDDNSDITRDIAYYGGERALRHFGAHKSRAKQWVRAHNRDHPQSCMVMVVQRYRGVIVAISRDGWGWSVPAALRLENEHVLLEEACSRCSG